jgi:hypothetical protein
MIVAAITEKGERFDVVAWAAKPSEQYGDVAGLHDALPPVDVFTDERWLDLPFYCDGWAHELADFTVWSVGRVYFPVQYAGNWTIGSAPRDPCGEACAYFGGG